MHAGPFVQGSLPQADPSVYAQSGGECTAVLGGLWHRVQCKVLVDQAGGANPHSHLSLSKEIANSFSFLLKGGRGEWGIICA